MMATQTVARALATHEQPTRSPVRVDVPLVGSQGDGLTPAESAVHIDGLVKSFRRGVTAVDHLDLVIRKGEILALVGPNGCGKSVTLRVLLGLIRPSAGQVRLFGQRVGPGAPVLTRVGAIVDGPGFVPHLSGLQNLRVASRLMGLHDGEADIDLAQQLAGLGQAIQRPYRTYSHGMRYRLAFAQALLGQPDLVILDEPTTGVDPIHAREVRAAIRRIPERGGTVLIATHLPHEMHSVATRVAVMRDGRLLRVAPVSQLCAAGATIEEAYAAILSEGGRA